VSAARKVLIGMEVHLRLATRTKLFCGCPNQFGAHPNSHVCPTCLGLPGALPVLNRGAAARGIGLALSLDATVAPVSRFDRKSYFYPDLPKGYQITQYDLPLATGGRIGNVRIERLHLEEDSGTSRHTDDGTLIDFNRAGVPLLEIVSKPDLETPEAAVEYVRSLREIARFAGFSSANMEQGHLRCEPNVNLVLPSGERTPIVELKNLNSLRSLHDAIAFEIERQASEKDRPAGKTTRGWDEERGETVLQRGKEESHDYRYFPEPDLPAITFSEEAIEGTRKILSRLPARWRERFVDRYGLEEDDAMALTSDPEFVTYAEAALSIAGRRGAKTAAILLRTDVRRVARERGACPVPAAAIGALALLIVSGRISRNTARHEVWPRMVEEGRAPAEIVATEGLEGRAGDDELTTIVAEAVAANPAAADAFRAGKREAVGPIVGAVLKRVRGGADPRVVREMVEAVIDGGDA
jgi:aspartyl-tRNA(Asn)/glutamyl-tRNA(Gln) amidotransferase subunit B